MTHWHDHNPWHDRAVYVPVERLAECVAGGKILIRHGGRADEYEEYNVAWLLAHWRAAGSDKLDAYILPQPGMHALLGVRYGAEGSQYFSPHNENPEITAALLEEFK